MAILEPGTFNVRDHRKAIPDWVKVATAIRMVMEMAASGRHVPDPAELARDLQYDHRPPLNARPFDTEAGDFIPPQNDPAHIDAILKAEHLQRTTGRNPGAEQTVTTRGSDVGEAAHIKDVQASEAIHKAKLASKAGDYEESARILASVPRQRRKRLETKRKIPSRPFSKQKRTVPTTKQ